MNDGLVALAPEGSVLDVDAVALEEDTYLVLSADPNPLQTHEKPEDLLQQVAAIEPESLGSVVVTGNNPLQFLAIVHDLDQDPTCREEWVASAFRGILRESEKRQLKRIALPMIGTVHGPLPPRRFIDLLSQALSEFDLEHLVKIWVVVPDGIDSEVLAQLRAFCSRFPSSDTDS